MSPKSKRPADHNDRRGAYVAATGYGTQSVLVEVEPSHTGLHVINTRHNPAAENSGEVERVALDSEDRCQSDSPHKRRIAGSRLQREGKGRVERVSPDEQMTTEFLHRGHPVDVSRATDNLEAVDWHMCREIWDLNSFGGHAPHLSATPFSPGEKGRSPSITRWPPQGLEDLNNIINRNITDRKLYTKEDSSHATD